MVPGDMDRIGRRMAKRVHSVAFCIRVPFELRASFGMKLGSRRPCRRE